MASENARRVFSELLKGVPQAGWGVVGEVVGTPAFAGDIAAPTLAATVDHVPDRLTGFKQPLAGLPWRESEVQSDAQELG